MLTCAELNENFESLVALKDSTAPLNDLVTNTDETVVYPSSSFSGHFYTYYRACLYGLKTICFLDTTRKPPAEAARLAALRVKESMLLLLQEMQRLDENLQMWRASKEDDDTATPLRQKVMEIGDTCFSLFNLVDPLHFETRLFCIQTVFHKVTNRPLFSEEDIQILERFQNNYASVVLEGITQSRIPFQPLQYLMEEKSLASPREEDEGKEWIEECRPIQYKITPHLIHRALARVADEDPIKLGRLESRLFQRKFYFLQKEDPLYTVWLHRLRPGSIVELIQLGNNANREFPLLESLGFDLFHLQKEQGRQVQNRMVLFGKGVTTCSLWEAFARSKESLVPVMKVLTSDPQRRFIVVEKVKWALDKQDWTSTPQNEATLRKVGELVKLLIARGCTPPTFRADCLFVTTSGEIVTMMPVTPGIKNDFYILFDFVKAVSQKRLHVFTLIMQKSGLKDHPVPLFYYAIANEHLSGKVDLSVRDKAALRRNTDPEIPRKAKAMIEQLKSYRLEMLRKYLPRETTPKATQAMEKKINQALLTFQRTTGVHFTEVADFEGAEAAFHKLMQRR